MISVLWPRLVLESLADWLTLLPVVWMFQVWFPAAPCICYNIITLSLMFGKREREGESARQHSKKYSNFFSCPLQELLSEILLFIVPRQQINWIFAPAEKSLSIKLISLSNLFLYLVKAAWRWKVWASQTIMETPLSILCSSAAPGSFFLGDHISPACNPGPRVKISIYSQFMTNCDSFFLKSI